MNVYKGFGEGSQSGIHEGMSRRIAQDGLIAGLIGAAAVAIWFLIVDTVSGAPLFTPAMLGRAAFLGFDASPATVELAPVAAYTALHVTAFVLVGTIAAAFTQLIDRFPSTLFLSVVLFTFFQVGFAVFVALVAEPILGNLAWFNVAIGNLIAAGGMGAYLWAANPSMVQAVRATPLSVSADH